MNTLPKYFTLWCIAPGNSGRRCQRKQLPSAKTFWERQLPALSANYTLAERGGPEIQKVLLSQFCEDGSSGQSQLGELSQRARAGLCLRCYVSEPILRACQKIDSLFSGDKAFSYQDLLPFVLNDDGSSLVLVEGKAQVVVRDDEQIEPTDFKIFSVEVLRTYNHKSTARVSLNNWAFLLTKQQPELKAFLSEYGFQNFSDGTLLNRIQANQMERLAERDRYLVEAFHAVYRRDRRKRKQTGRCEDPDEQQLAEMKDLLQQRKVTFNSQSDVLKALQQIAQQLRQFDIWQSREPLEVQDKETGDYALRVDLPADAADESAIEEHEFLTFLRQQLYVALDEAIAQAVQNKLAKLKKSKKYAPFAPSFATGILRYYEEGISLKDIGAELGMKNWDQTRRILNPGELLSQARALAVQKLLAPILEKAQAKGLAATPAEPGYLKNLMEQLEAFMDTEIFAAAASELKAGKNRSLDSEYAQHLTQYLGTL